MGLWLGLRGVRGPVCAGPAGEALILCCCGRPSSACMRGCLQERGSRPCCGFAGKGAFVSDGYLALERWWSMCAGGGRGRGRHGGLLLDEPDQAGRRAADAPQPRNRPGYERQGRGGPRLRQVLDAPSVLGFGVSGLCSLFSACALPLNGTKMCYFVAALKEGRKITSVPAA